MRAGEVIMGKMTLLTTIMRIDRLFLSAAVAAAGLISCHRAMEEAPAERNLPAAEKDLITVHASADEVGLPAGAASRTSLGSYGGHDNAVLWGRGEYMRLAITSGGSSVFATSNDSSADENEGSPEAVFTFSVSPVADASYLYQGIYPASAALEVDNDDPENYRVMLPSVQNASAGSYDPAAFIMIARPEVKSSVEDWKASFRRASALNCLTLKGIPAGKSISRVEIVAPDGIFLSGVRSMNLSTGESGKILEGSRSVDVRYAEPLPGGADMDIMFTSWEGIFEAGMRLTVIAYSLDNLLYSKEIVIPEGHPIYFTEGKLNLVSNVGMGGIEPVASLFSGGSGTALCPWQIATKADLELMSSKVNSDADFRDDCYVQTADIDYGGGTHQAMGNTNASPGCYFTGSYRGNGYRISNIVIANSQSSKAVGFFGYIDGAAHVDRLHLENASVVGTTWNIGTIVGCVQSTATSALIENCVVSGEVSGNNSAIGGICGKLMAGTLSACSFTGTVTATSNNTGHHNYGGIVGELYAGRVTGCRVYDATVKATYNNWVGGIAGSITNGAAAAVAVVDRCSVEGSTTVQGAKGRVGGILGSIESGKNGIVNLCRAGCTVKSTDTGAYGHVGGIVGLVNGTGTLVANSVFLGGTISNAGTGGGVGGVVGNLAVSGNELGPVVFNCCAFPDKVETGSGSANIAGIAGYVNTVSIRNCYCPVPASAFFFNGAADGASRGSIYGWLRGNSGNESGISASLQDVYWLSGWKAGNFSGSYKYEKSEQELSDVQMRGSGSVTRPSTSVVYGSFIEALDASVEEWNSSGKLFGVAGVYWKTGESGYPVPAEDAPSPSPVPKKKVSLLGDSITTYQGYTPYPANYQYPKAAYTGFDSVSLTWWHQLIYTKMTNAMLEVNSSYTGTCVQNTTEQGHPGYGFLQRCSQLGNPDVIIVNGGTNDAWSYSLPVGSLDFSLPEEGLDTYQFAQAYDKLVRLLRKHYPSAEICCVIGDNVMDASKSEYARVICDVCAHYGIPYAEVVFADRASSTYDNVHPNVAGMADMAAQVYGQLKDYLD